MTLDPVLARRLLAVSVAPVVIAAGIILYGFPGRTAELFAWPIAPRMTPIVMGAGYLAAAWFFFALYRSHDWAAVAPVLSGVLTFTVVMLASTLLHWERFSHHHFTFWLWLLVYLASPVAVAGVILLHRGHHDAPDDGVRVPAVARLCFGMAFGLLATTALTLVFAPSVMIGLWPWKLSPLTARVIGGWVSVLAVGGLQMSFSSSWRRWPLALETGALWFALIAVALPGARSDFTSGQSFLGFATVLGVLLLSFAGTWLIFRARARRS